MACNASYTPPFFHFKLKFKMSIQQKYELFADFLNNIYDNGYAEYLAINAPDTFDYEFEIFCKNYNL